MKRFGSGVVSLLLVAVLTAMLSPVSMSFAAVLNDEVTSQKFKEADGTSGQNTNSGSGVKTGHIQDGAVTAVKIIDGAVTDAKITGTISGSKLGAHGHNASDLVGTINSSNLPIGNASGTVAAGDHSHDSAYQKKYANIIVVAKSGGDFTDPVAAISSINDASAANPYLVKVMPGVYNIANASISMKEFVDLEGSGENTTIITGNPSGNAVLSVIGNSELRFITIENTGGANSDSIAIKSYGVAKFLNVTAKASNASGGGHNIGIYIMNGDFILTNVNCLVKGRTIADGQKNWGLYVTGNVIASISNTNITAVDSTENRGIGLFDFPAGSVSNIVFNNVKVTAYGAYGGVGIMNGRNAEIVNSSIFGDLYGIISSSGELTIMNSKIKGSVSGIYNNGTSIIKVSFSQIDGPVVGEVTCFNAHDVAFAPITCQ